jgi:hypothetical protein
MMNAPYYIKVFEYSKSEKKYKHDRDFFPGTINLKYAENVVCSGTRPCKLREKGFFNPFSKNFLKSQEGIQHFSYIANIVAVELEKSIWPNDTSGFGRYIDIASFKNLGKDKVKGEDKYSQYILVIDGKEYDMEMLKDKIDYYNMLLVNKYNEYCLEGLE